MRPRTLLPFAVAALLLAASSGVARADIILLRNGRRIEAEVVGDDGVTLRFRIPGGIVEMPRRDVESVERTASPEERVAMAMQGADAEDPDAIERIARFAAAVGLPEQSEDLAELARGLRLEQRLAALPEGDVDAAAALMRWANAEGYSPDVLSHLADRVLECDPDHKGARDLRAAIRRAQTLERLEREARSRAEAAPAPPEPPAPEPEPAPAAEDAEARRRIALEQAELARLRAMLDAERAALEAELARLSEGRRRARRLAVRRVRGGR